MINIKNSGKYTIFSFLEQIEMIKSQAPNSKQYSMAEIQNSKLFNIKAGMNVHFIGIGGTGMSGLARIFQNSGIKVSGSDQEKTKTTIALQKEKIKIYIGHSLHHVAPNIDAVIYSPAISDANIELLEAKKRHIPLLSYPQAVGLLTHEKKTICICGTHGKTTTTAMAATVFIKTKKDPTVLVGATVKALHNQNSRSGKSPWFILEACEYKRGFLNYKPKFLIITNIEADHLDYFKGEKDYEKAFREFVEKVPEDGLIVAYMDDPRICREQKFLFPTNARIIWFGTSKKADYHLLKNKIYFKKHLIGELNLKIPGEHNRLNATAVIALADALKLPMRQTIKALNSYEGAGQRFEKIGKIGKTTIIDDYGHHPTEIIATLRACREKFGKKAKILCIFQPHQYSRTYKLLDGFARAFQGADEVIIPNIFKVRDTAADVAKISPPILVKEISKHHPCVRYGGGLEKTFQHVQKRQKDFDVIITMGAGNVGVMAKKLVNFLP